MIENINKKYWAAYYWNKYISVRIYHGLQSRKSITSAFKNQQIEWIIMPFLASCRQDAEDKVRRKLKSLGDENA